MASDAIERAGLQLAPLTTETKQELQAQLPPAASVANPIDVLGDALADRYALAIEAALADPNVNAVLVVLTPQTMTQIPETAEALGKPVEADGKAGLRRLHGRPGDPQGRRGAALLRRAQLPGARAGRGGHRGHVALSQMAEHAAAGRRSLRRSTARRSRRSSPRCAPKAA